MTGTTLSTWTEKAKKYWNQMSEQKRKEIADASWCPACNSSGCMEITGAKVHGEVLVLKGICRNCGENVAQAVE